MKRNCNEGEGKKTRDESKITTKANPGDDRRGHYFLAQVVETWKLKTSRNLPSSPSSPPLSSNSRSPLPSFSFSQPPLFFLSCNLSRSHSLSFLLYIFYFLICLQFSLLILPPSSYPSFFLVYSSPYRSIPTHLSTLLATQTNVQRLGEEIGLPGIDQTARTSSKYY